mgnify:CR=1 FL=1
MLFFTKKKRNEMDSKLDLILEELAVNNQRYEEISGSLSSIENRLNCIEEKTEKNHQLVLQELKLYEHTVKEEINKLREDMNALNMTITGISGSIEENRSVLQNQILNDGAENREKLLSMTRELKEKLDLLDSSLRLLLLNSVMDQITGE